MLPVAIIHVSSPVEACIDLRWRSSAVVVIRSHWRSVVVVSGHSLSGVVHWHSNSRALPVDSVRRCSVSTCHGASTIHWQCVWHRRDDCACGGSLYYFLYLKRGWQDSKEMRYQRWLIVWTFLLYRDSIQSKPCNKPEQKQEWTSLARMPLFPLCYSWKLLRKQWLLLASSSYCGFCTLRCPIFTGLHRHNRWHLLGLFLHRECLLHHLTRLHPELHTFGYISE